MLTVTAAVQQPRNSNGKGNALNVRGAMTASACRSNTIDGDGPDNPHILAKRQRLDRCGGRVNNPLADTGANVSISSLPNNKTKRKQSLINIGSITGTTPFNGTCKQTFHIVEHNTLCTRPVTIGTIDAAPGSTPYDIISVGLLRDLNPRNHFITRNNGRDINMRIHDDNGESFETALTFRQGTAWLSARESAVHAPIVNVQTRNQIKQIQLSHQHHIQHKNKRKLSKMHKTPIQTKSKLKLNFSKMKLKQNKQILIKSSTGKMINAPEVHLERHMRLPLRLAHLKMQAIDLDVAHRHCMCISSQVLQRSIPSWLRAYIKKGSKLSACDCCTYTGTGPAGSNQSSHKVDRPLHHGHEVYIDFQYQSTPALGGMTSVLHAICGSSKFVAAAYAKTRLKEPTADMIRSVLNQMWIAGLPAPTIIYMDNDASANSSIMPELQKERNFVFLPFPQGSPAKNGLIENFHKTINKMRRSASHRANETPDWIWFMLDRHAIDIWNHYMTHGEATMPPAQLVTGRRSCDTHLFTFFAEARVGNVARTKSNPHKGDDTRIKAFYVGRHQHGAYFFDPISGNIIYASQGNYSIVDDLAIKRSTPLPELNKYRTAPQLFPAPSFIIPAKTNALSSGLISLSDTASEEQRTSTAKRIRLSQKNLTLALNLKRKTVKSATSNHTLIPKGKSLGDIIQEKQSLKRFTRLGSQKDPTALKGTTDIIGWTIKSMFDDGTYTGHIESFNPKDNLFTITYDDGDSEQLWPSELFNCELTPPSINRLSITQPASVVQNDAINFLQFISEQRNPNPWHKHGIINFLTSNTIKHRAQQSIKALKSCRKRTITRALSLKARKMNKIIESVLLKRPKRRVQFKTPLCTIMPFRSAHRRRDKTMLEHGNHDTTPDDLCNVVDLVTAMRQSDSTKPKFDIEFDIRHSSVAEDKETSDMDHCLTLDISELDGHLVVNTVSQYDMGDTPKLKNVLQPNHPLYDVWCKGVLTELLALQANKIIRPISLDQLTKDERRHLLPSQIILKMKRSPDANRTPIRAKARWVVGGHRAISKELSETDYYHFDKVASKGCNASTLRLLTALSVAKRLLLKATDITQAFTTADLDATNPNRVLIRLPKEIETRDSRGVPIVILLLKNVYGMPNAGYLFAQALDNHLADLGFEPSRGDHNLHRRFNDNNEIQLYACYIDDGTALFPKEFEYEQFLTELQAPQKHTGNRFTLGLAKVQDETLGCQVKQAMHQPAIGKPDEPGYVPENYIEIEHGENYTIIYQPGLISQIIELALLQGNDINPVQVPITPTLAKMLDETIPMKASHDALLKKREAARKANKRFEDIHDDLDPFDEIDDVSHNGLLDYAELNEKEQQAYKMLQPIFGTHYRTIVGKLLYLSRFTRPDISTTVSILSRYVSKPGYHSMAALKQICRYLKGTPRHGIRYTEPPKGKQLEVRFYADSNYPVGRARLGYVAMIGYTDEHQAFHGQALDWHSRLSGTTSTSTAEAELYAAYHTVVRALILKKDLDHAQITNPEQPCRCFEDNKAVFTQFNSPLIRTSLTWIQNKYLRCLELVASGDITVEHVPSINNIADVMTKGTLSIVDFIKFRKIMMGM